ncbi:hypothetical protein GW17_00062268 [Ensete ventricosum]|nr:hypothetical protein GW17_00062268 [Ensete ventricosum]
MRYIIRLVNAHKFYKMSLLILLFLVQSLSGVLCAVIQKLFSFRYGHLSWMVLKIHLLGLLGLYATYTSMSRLH